MFTSVTTRIFLTGLTAVGLLGLGYFTLSKWMSSPWIQEFPAKPKVPFTMTHIIALTTAVFSLPSGFMLALHALSSALRLSKMRNSLLILPALAAICGSVIYWVHISHFEEYYSECLGFYHTLAIPVVLVSIALLVAFLFTLCCHHINLERNIVDAINTDIQKNAVNSPKIACEDENTLIQGPKYSKASLFTKLGVILALFIFFFFLTTAIPNQFRTFAPNRAADRLSLIPTTDEALCTTSTNKYHCPEKSGALFTTIGLKITPFIVLKLFPSNLIYYVGLCSALIFTVILQSYGGAINTKLHQKWRVPRYTIFTLCSAKGGHRRGARIDDKNSNYLGQSDHYHDNEHTKHHHRKNIGNYAYWSGYEILFSVFTTFILFAFTYYWLVDHNFKNAWPTKTPLTIANKLMRSFGQVSTFLLSLLMFPAARTSPLLQIFGISFENALTYHKIAGVIFMLAILFHMIAAYWVYLEKANYVFSKMIHDIFIFPQTSFGPRDDWSIFVIQIISWMSFVTIGFISIYEPIRRKKYNFFILCHHLTYITMIPATLWHATTSWQYLLPAVSIYLTDRIVRYYRGLTSRGVSVKPTLWESHQIDQNDPKQIKIPKISSQSGVHIINHGLAGDFITIKLTTQVGGYFLPSPPSPGQYYFINIAELSLFEWHPFTVSANLHESVQFNYKNNKEVELEFIIKSNGANTWTGALYKYVKECIELHSSTKSDPIGVIEIPLTISLDGPYGAPVDIHQYDNLILIGGGIGITPIKSIYESLLSKYTHDMVDEQNNIGSDACKLQQHAENNDNGHDNQTSNHELQGTGAQNKQQNIHLVFAARDPSLCNLMHDALLDTVMLSSDERYTSKKTQPFPFSADLVISRKYGACVDRMIDGNSLAHQQLWQQRDAIMESQIATLCTQSRKYHKIAELIQEYCVKRNILLKPSCPSDDCHKEQLLFSTPINEEQDQDLSTSPSLSPPTTPQKTLIFVCGPQSLVDSAVNFAYENNIEIHTEVFEF